MERIRAVYHVRCAPDEVERTARWIAVEQTVEVPESLIRSEEVVGSVAGIEALADRFVVTVDFAAALAHGQLPQLLNLVYGNVSIRGTVRLADLELPDSFLARFRGPNLGGAGIRELAGVHGRPLLATALKPRGLAVPELAALAGAFAAGGGDLVKDDHNLVDDSFEEFADRVARCQEAVAAAGGRCLYVPNLCAPVGELTRYAEHARSLGIHGVMVAPLILGLDTMRRLAETQPLFFLTHPTFSGALHCDPDHGIEPGLLLGTLFRLAGADVSVFTNYGGRFQLSEADCRSVARRLRSPLGAHRPALPAPAGGMRFDDLPAMARAYGPDSVFLIGGDLLGHAPDVADGTRAFRERIEDLFA